MVLVDGNVAAGPHEVVWDGTADNGRGVASGLYFCKMTAGEFVAAKKLVVMM